LWSHHGFRDYIAMKFLHTADWHLGKSLGGASFLPDQAELLRRQFLRMVEETRPDAVLIAGDVFDRAIPPVEAVELLDTLLAEIVLRLETRVVLIPGNHDAADRLAFGAAVMRHQGLHIEARCLGGPLTLHDEHGPVTLFASGYASPALMGTILAAATEIADHDAGFGLLCDALRRDLPQGSRSLLVAHAFVAGGEESDSERLLQVGGAKAVSAARFAGFDYVALGHLHRPQTLGDGRIRYSGSPIAYSFAEAGHAKSATLVEMDATGAVRIEALPFDPPRALRTLEGTLDAVLAQANRAWSGDWFRIRLTDPVPVWGAMERLRADFGTVLDLSFARHDLLDLPGETAGRTGDDPLDLLDAFFAAMRGAAMTAEAREVARLAIEAARAEEA
jgi:exonuclease SbcD